MSRALHSSMPVHSRSAPDRILVGPDVRSRSEACSSHCMAISSVSLRVPVCSFVSGASASILVFFAISVILSSVFYLCFVCVCVSAVCGPTSRMRLCIVQRLAELGISSVLCRKDAGFRI